MGHGPGRWRGRPARARWAAVNGRRRDEGRAGPWRFSTLAPDWVNDGEALVLSLEAEEASRRGTCGRDKQEGQRGRPAGAVHRRDNGEGGARRRRGKRDGGRGWLGAGASPLDASGSMQSKRMQEHMKQMVAGTVTAWTPARLAGVEEEGIQRRLACGSRGGLADEWLGQRRD